MIDKDMIETLTLVYAHSYQVALKEIGNPELAIQIAMGVTGMIKAMDYQKTPNQTQVSPMDFLLAAMIQGVKPEAEPDSDK